MELIAAHGSPHQPLTEDEIHTVASEALARANLDAKRVLVIIPDSTRSGPIPLFFRLVCGLLRYRVAKLDFLVALGTHQPMTREAIWQHLGVTEEQMERRYAGVQVFNHHWESPQTFLRLGQITASEIEAMSNGLLSQEVQVSINRKIFDYDHLIICGPVFPHEVAGFSGGNKYLFPGISGGEMINVTHWLGALITCFEIIGTKHTPVRAMIDRAAAMIDLPIVAFCFVVASQGLAGLYVGSPEEAWSKAADLSSGLHIKYVPHAFHQVLSVMPGMYEDLWTGAKGMYKLEPVVADGGELILYAPHIREISHTHGQVMDRIGYHVRDYFTSQWERFRHEPWGVLAHSTHLRGNGTFVNGREQPRIQVTLATGIPPERCAHVNLGYRDPAGINPADWAGREEEGILLVPKAGEILYRLGGQGQSHVHSES